jgi:hypothetical protein
LIALWERDQWLTVGTDIGRVQGIDVRPRAKTGAEQLGWAGNAIFHHQTIHIYRHTTACFISVLNCSAGHFWISNEYRFRGCRHVIVHFMRQIDGAIGLRAVQLNLRHAGLRV